MIVHFFIHFTTEWNQHIVLQQYESSDMDSKSQIHEMTVDQNFVWSVQFDVKNVQNIFYKYAVRENKTSLVYEYGQVRNIPLDFNHPVVEVKDSWVSVNNNKHYLSKVFTNCFYKRKEYYEIPHQTGNLIFEIFYPSIPKNCHIAILGNQPLLGDWDSKKKIRLEDVHFPRFILRIELSKIKLPIEYKYVLVDSQTDKILAWEEGENRRQENINKKAITYIHDSLPFFYIPPPKVAGVSIPVFSLRTNDSFGIGEFHDLKLLIDWAKLTNQKIIQILPINDTTQYYTDADSYPYNTVSVFALHPIYLHLEDVGKLKNSDKRHFFENKKTLLNDLTSVDYSEVMSLKIEYLNAIFLQEGNQTLKSDEFQLFLNENKDWLLPYSVFNYLKNLYGTPDFRMWFKYGVYQEDDVMALANPENPAYSKIAFHYFVQYHLHLQLTEVSRYAEQNGIALKGDIPIGVSPTSVETWVNPELFHTNYQTGAPPDDFSVNGQNWGFPVYNWINMEKTGYRWWKRRLENMSKYFHAYRIDHILGFFRIWSIPVQEIWGLNGFFQPSLPLTVQELAQKGITWDEDRYTKPYINVDALNKIFKTDTQKIADKYLIKSNDEFYKFKNEFDTQKKIKTHFEKLDRPLSETENSTLNGLLSLHCEVLFLKDSEQSGKYHPRINFQQTNSFKALPEEIQQILCEIHTDYFYHRHTAFWKHQALTKLPMLIGSTNMLVCGEDLGMIPESVPEVMNLLEILSLEVERMSKTYAEEFAIPMKAPYLSVCTTSTHDMSPIRAWWEEDKDKTQRYYNNILKIKGKAPETCSRMLSRKIIEQHLQSQAMLVILPWQDWMSMEPNLCVEDVRSERINVPSNPSQIWNYRMHLSLENLLKQDNFNSKIAQMITDSGRYCCYEENVKD